MKSEFEIPAGFINARLLNEDGTMKVVFKAFDVSSKSWKILKRFREPPSEEMLQEEMRPLARLKHPNIVVQDPPRHIGEDIWVIEEILDLTLDDLAPLNHKYGIAVYSGQIAEAIAYLHDPVKHGGKAMVHGDIHLKNCGLVRGIAKLFDFGKATYANSDVPKGQGYVCTRAPEQFDQTARVETTIDMWAFGCTLYGLRTAEYPFITPRELESYRSSSPAARKEMDDQLVARVRAGMTHDVPLRLREKFDDELWGVIELMVQPDPEARATAQEIVHQLNAYRELIQVVSVGHHENVPSTLAKQARDALTRGDVKGLEWFTQLVDREVTNTHAAGS